MKWMVLCAGCVCHASQYILVISNRIQLSTFQKLHIKQKGHCFRDLVLIKLWLSDSQHWKESDYFQLFVLHYLIQLCYMPKSKGKKFKKHDDYFVQNDKLNYLAYNAVEN